MIDTALILAGGFGTRLQTVVSDLPKPMAPINGEPFLNYQLRYLKHYGIKKVVLSLGYLHQKIENHYQQSFEGISVHYVIEEHPLGTGGGIRLAMEKCNSEFVFALNGDSFFDVNLIDFYNQHKQSEADVSLALREVEDAARYGTIVTNTQHKIISFKEKSGQFAAGTINAGVYILNTQTFLKETNANTNFSIEKDFFEKKLNELKLCGFKADGYFIDIGIPEDYSKAQHDFKEFKYR
ncbi:MAG: nucleotidyltransferase family protein [Bacteroidia bacterium]|nr:nucleotidyltransferase family protein [Bacteroidia bacterium]